MPRININNTFVLTAAGASRRTLMIVGVALALTFYGIAHAVVLAHGTTETASAMVVLLALIAFCVPAYLTGRCMDELRTQSRTDTMTAVGNRRFLEERIEQELARQGRTNEPLSLLFIDVDELKTINDKYGHNAGDDALETVAKVLSNCVRASDSLGRYGGDEFIVVAPETTCQAAELLVSRITEQVANTGRHFDQDGRIPVSVSIGVVTTSSATVKPAKLIDVADRAMYRVKCRRREARTSLTSSVPARPLFSSVVSSNDTPRPLGTQT